MISKHIYICIYYYATVGDVGTFLKQTYMYVKYIHDYSR